MKRLLASAAIMASMLAAAPAVAQPYQNYQSGWNSGDFWRGAPSGAWERIQYLQDRINRGVSDGSLSRGEAQRAQRQLQQIRREAWQMRRDGVMSPRDSANL